jgi:hypothetical protein
MVALQQSRLVSVVAFALAPIVPARVSTTRTCQRATHPLLPLLFPPYPPIQTKSGNSQSHTSYQRRDRHSKGKGGGLLGGR